MLSSSQREAEQLLTQLLAEDCGAVILQGLSGSGKSLVADRVLANESEGAAFEIGTLFFNVEKIQQAVAAASKKILLALPGSNPELIAKKIDLHPQTVVLRNLTLNETNAWLDEAVPPVTPEEREIVLHYGLGTPLLIERFLAHRPVTHVSALPQCAAYLQDVINQSFLQDSSRDHGLTETVARFSDFPIPDDVRPFLADALYARKGSPTPLAVLESKRRPGKEFPVPATLQLYDLYSQWLKERPDEPSFEVFVESMPDAQAFLEEIGYCDFPDRSNAALHTFVMADARKGTTFYPRMTSGKMDMQMDNNRNEGTTEYLQEHMLALARSSGFVAELDKNDGVGQRVVTVRTPDLPAAMFLHKHDHTHDVVMPVAYTGRVRLAGERRPVHVASQRETLPI